MHEEAGLRQTPLMIEANESASSRDGTDEQLRAGSRREGGNSSSTTWLTWSKEFVGLAAAAGALLYIALSVLYSRYYGSLGLEPEDVGLTQASIVARSAAGVIVIAVGAALYAVLASLLFFGVNFLQWVVLQFATRSMSVEERARYEARLDTRPMRLFSQIQRFLLGVNLIPPGGERPANPLIGNRQGVLAGVLFTIVVALSSAFAAGWISVDAASEDAKAGRNVSGLNFIGLRLLDISSTPCRVTWLAAQPATVELSDQDLHCLGEADGKVTFRTSTTTLRVPSSAVALAFE